MLKDAVRNSCLCLALAACGPTSAPADESTGDTASTTTTGASPTTTSGTSTTADPATTTTSETTASVDPSTSAAPTTSDDGFITTPDGGGCGAAFDPDREFRCVECDTFQQDCAAGEKCVAWANDGGESWNAHKCVPVTGAGVAGDPCTVEGGGFSGHDDCALGHMCWDVDDADHGTCVALCTGSEESPVCAEGLGCLLANDGALNLCLLACDPLVQDCAGDDLCVEFGEFVCVPDPVDMPGATNDPCASAVACDQGFACLDPQASSACDQGRGGCCQPFCPFPGGACPNPDQTCQQWFDPEMGIPEGSEDIGVCSATR